MADPVPTAGGWKYLPPPADEPDPHTESESRATTTADGLALFGARVRGKKHKHEGGHCDDWFDFRCAGRWTCVAVSDGAGSRKWSRVGARASCEAAVASLAGALEGHALTQRPWSNETFRQDATTGAFGEPDLEHARQALHAAMRAGYDAVEAAAVARGIAVNDLSATLLLAVHALVPFRDRNYGFVLACQIGDGMTAAVNTSGELHLLGTADTGQFSGETDFLTSRARLEPASLTAKTFFCFAPLRALMVMTDGVADDYFPPQPELLRLYGDLACNGILPGRPDSDDFDEADTVLDPDSDLPLTDLSETSVDIDQAVDRLTAGGVEAVRVRSVARFAEHASLPLARVLASPSLLALAARGAKLPGDTPEGRLLVWLDSYQVRGSFDDRTLVLLHGEKPS